MFPNISEKQKNTLGSFVELLCLYFKGKEIPLKYYMDRSWFIENRQRIGCLPNTPGAEEKFGGWFNSLEKGDKNIWARFLGDLSDAGVSEHMYAEVKKYSPFADELIVVKRGAGEIYLSKHEGHALMKNVFPVECGETFLVFSIDRRQIIYPRP
ncbi:MAG: hypothetical protein HY764_03415 [Candidatus Portnoybacteria bacterium]|nr:hypothetical protein [Candidatus Portnoybacteria bacterium]